MPPSALCVCHLLHFAWKLLPLTLATSNKRTRGPDLVGILDNHFYSCKKFASSCIRKAIGILIFALPLLMFNDVRIIQYSLIFLKP